MSGDTISVDQINEMAAKLDLVSKKDTFPCTVCGKPLYLFTLDGRKPSNGTGTIICVECFDAQRIAKGKP